MYCPFCQAIDTKVVDSRLTDDGGQVRRRRECLKCEERFTTFEIADLAIPQIIKRDGRRNAFDKNKLRQGIERALEKRPVSLNEVERIVQLVIHLLRATGESEVSSTLLGEWVMEALKKVDAVAYVRFASVYRSFQDVNAFDEEIQKLKQGALHE